MKFLDNEFLYVPSVISFCRKRLAHHGPNASVNDEICLPLADVLTMHHTRPHNFVYKVNSVNGVQPYIKNP